MTETPDPEFPRPVAVDSLDDGETDREISANAAERAALAARFAVVAVNRLEARLVLTRPGADLVEVRGRLNAEVVQTCVVSLQEFATEIDEEVALSFTAQPEEAPATDGEAEDFEDLDAEPPEPIVDGVIDLGEAVAQQVFMDLDSFPRAPGIEFAGYQAGDGSSPQNEEQDNGASPFAKLAELREKL